ncbi:M23 family metallopeptidase [uncultured Bacteroides sp.]|uniref:M23 family metallopeptidase n=1 Tax=uncultured Bacteroides sp. TaxID=162156 RepID=UPI0025E97BBD|nr:M23 family metallopeptidase [uncultured Bacteroides sp.]
MICKNIRYAISLFFLFFAGGVQGGYAQEASDMNVTSDVQPASFIPPFDFPIVFSGNFGEIRANHFHGGLDFKTGGTISKPVHALADGHISRIRVTHGSGYVLDVDYDNGYSTINRHLSAFVGDIARRVKALQYEKESWEVEIVPEPGEYPVKAGQVIALSGNTGYSFGPHLHLDMIESATGDYVDPLPFFMKKVKDNTAPRAEGIILFPQPGKGVVDGKQVCQVFPVTPVEPITAWGVIGAGIRAYDYMDGVTNRYGVHTVILEVDGVEVFRSVVDRFAYEENRYINSWTHGQYMKSFIEPGNRLRLLHASNGNRGLIEISEERPYRFVYTLSDALGNTSRVRFTVLGKKTDIRPVEHREKYLFRWNRTNYLQEPGLELVVPRGMLYDDVRLNYSVRADSGDVAFTYQLHDTRIPLHGACEMRIGLRIDRLEDKSKYYVAGVTAKGGKYSIGGIYEDGFMKVRIRDLATYTVAIDTVPPEITPLNPQQWGRTGRIVFKAKDKETGIAGYRGTIDGKYALFGKLNSINGNLICELDPEHVKKGGKHTVEMTVTDGCGNQTIRQFHFVW